MMRTKSQILDDLAIIEDAVLKFGLTRQTAFQRKAFKKELSELEQLPTPSVDVEPVDYKALQDLCKLLYENMFNLREQGLLKDSICGNMESLIKSFIHYYTAQALSDKDAEIEKLKELGRKLCLEHNAKDDALSILYNSVMSKSWTPHEKSVIEKGFGYAEILESIERGENPFFEGTDCHQLHEKNTALTSKLDEAVGLLKHANIRIHNLGFAFNKNKDGGEILESYADEKINTFLASLDKPEPIEGDSDEN